MIATAGRAARTFLGADRPMTWRRVIRDAMVLLGIVGAVTYWIYLTTGGGLPVDVHYYWAADPHNLYPHPEAGEGNGYNYSPAFEFVVGWWRGIPFESFAAIWRAILLAMLVWLAGPFTLPVLLTVPVASEINAANIQIPLAAAVVLGFRWPATWAFVILTKLTPGIGLLWFVLRRQWRHLVIAGGVTAAIAAASFVLMPDAWFGYVRLLTGEPAPAVAPYYLSFWTRLPFSVALVAVGAWRGWRWPVAAAATVALPVYYITSSAMFVGVLPFLRRALGRWLDERDRGRAGANPDSASSSSTSLSVDSAR
jgi:hypothetical protein